VENALCWVTIIRNVGTECPDMKVECFPGIRIEQLQRVIERRELGSPDSVVIRVGTNDFKKNWKFRLRNGRCLRSGKYSKD
jgi:hypothetical protein